MLEDVAVEAGNAISPKKHCADGVMMDESAWEPNNSDQINQNKSVDALLKCAYLQDNVSDDMMRTHDILTMVNGLSNNLLHDYFWGDRGSMTARAHYLQGLSGIVDG